MIIRLVKFLLLMLAVASTACTKQKDTPYYLSHPEKIQAVYDHCLRQAKEGVPADENCSAVYRAIPIVKQNLTELINSPVQFGLEIMKEQNALVNLEKSYTFAVEHQDTSFAAKLNEAIKRQKNAIAARYALIRLIRSP